MFSLLKKYWKPLAILLLTAFSFLRTYSAGYDSADAEWQRKWAERDAKAAEALVQQQAAVRVAEQRQQRDVAAIDEKYTQELADAKKTIADLQRDVDSGKRRLHIKATCKGMPETAASTRLADAASPQLTPDAERAYYRLREQIATAEKQIAGLKAYIREIQR